jgi:hypothetical protein
MKTYTPEERIAAKDKLPKPVSDFLSSDIITNLYSGIRKKYDIGYDTISTISDIVNVTLLRLEAESALETNLHQTFPRLPNETLRELVADIGDRIFKEARRWEEENIALADDWDQEELGPRSSHTEEDDLLSDEELEQLVEKENAEKQAVADMILRVANTQPTNSSPTETAKPQEEIPDILRDAMMTK